MAIAEILDLSTGSAASSSSGGRRRRSRGPQGRGMIFLRDAALQKVFEDDDP